MINKILDWIEKYIFKSKIIILIVLIILAILPDIISLPIVINRYPSISLFISQPDNIWITALSFASFFSILSIVGLLIFVIITYIHQKIIQLKFYTARKNEIINLNDNAKKLLYVLLSLEDGEMYYIDIRSSLALDLNELSRLKLVKYRLNRIVYNSRYECRIDPKAKKIIKKNFDRIFPENDN